MRLTFQDLLAACLVIALLPCCTSGQEVPTDGPEVASGDSPGTGPPERLNGLFIWAEVPAPGSFTAGAPIPITCHLTNETQGPLTIEKPWVKTAFHLYLMAEDALGEPLRSPLDRTTYDKTLGWEPGQPLDSWIITIATGATFNFEVDLHRVFNGSPGPPLTFEESDTVENPGTYAVRCVYHSSNMYGGAANWSGDIVSAPIPVTVVSP